MIENKDVGGGKRGSSVLKIVGLGVLVLLLVVGITLAVVWHRLTALPDWYTSPDMIAEDGSPKVDQDWVRIPHGEPHAGAFVLRNPHLRAPVAPGKPAPPLRKAIKQSRATFEQGDLEAGAVLNLSEMDLDSLSESDRARYEQTIDAFPALTGRDVYVGIEGGIEKSGRIALGPDTQIRIGDTHYSLATAAKRLKMSESQLRETIEKELAGMNVEPPTK